MQIQAGCKTTAMGIMPHREIDRALSLALSLDIPFWTQLPKVSFYEDMYAQSSQNLPGIVVEPQNERVLFDSSRFENELANYSQKLGDPATFTLSEDYSAVYHSFLSKDLRGYHAIRGQITGPISFGFKIVDENDKSIIYSDEIRSILFDFFQRKTNVQCRELRVHNDNAFVWLDEPGLGWVFSSLSGYDDIQARNDYLDFVSGLDRPRALHLCANVNLPYLLELGIDILSFDAYQIETMPSEYSSAAARFMRDGGIICWGIVPTDSTNLDGETPESLGQRLVGYWESMSQNTGLTLELIVSQSLLAPARCCLKNIGQVGAAGEAACPITENGTGSSIEERLVERAFGYLREMSQSLKDKYGM
ncbi:MAG: hypothetical protein JSV02_02450 [Dehalococcoidia bacterium]|nr:MAG: hypothetical protein JSV02_02450 [Dehalococcoidia bacterium]